LLTILRQFAAICQRRGDPAHADLFRHHARDLQADLELHAWDGKWYRRAYFDDGAPLGSVQNDECRIDSLAQSWAVISGGAHGDRARQAMESVDEHLVRRADRLVLLFAPPFDHGKLEPGYIKGYVPGIRENGGQYTHAALWVAQAWALLGDGTRAVEILDLLNPILHAGNALTLERYGLEPFVVAADVYGMPPHIGRGGWSWYTGSASWFYRVVIENIFGFTLEGNRLRLKPNLPAHWPAAELTYRYRSAVYMIKLECAEATPTKGPHLTVDGQESADGYIPLLDDGHTHNVVYRC
jgi:cellobiose phosphorylase